MIDKLLGDTERRIYSFSVDMVSFVKYLTKMSLHNDASREMLELANSLANEFFNLTDGLESANSLEIRDGKEADSYFTEIIFNKNIANCEQAVLLLLMQLEIFKCPPDLVEAHGKLLTDIKWIQEALSQLKFEK